MSIIAVKGRHLKLNVNIELYVFVNVCFHSSIRVNIYIQSLSVQQKQQQN